MQLVQWQTKGTKIWTSCSICHEHRLDGNGEFFLREMKIDDDLCCLNPSRNCPQLSASCAMPKNFTPTFVYQRKRHRKDSVNAVEPCAGTKSTDACPPVNFPLLNLQEHVISGEEPDCEEVLATDLDRNVNVTNANDNCSSSKSNLALSSAALKIDVDDAGECSSSGALVSKKPPEGISERDACISILRTLGLLDGVSSRHTESNGVRIDNYTSKLCKVCERKERTKNLLICDNCEDAFHISCYDPPIAILPVSEWLCSSCLKKRRKILMDKSTSNAVNNSTETGGRRFLASDVDLGSLEFMFRDTEPYMSNVRIGNEYQAEVPDWRGPMNKESDLGGDPLEIHQSNNINMQEQDSVIPLKLSSIGNWLQCREVIEGVGEGVDGTVCGKWRRAPLFEVQTDNWECFRSVLWNPAHADCSVPQELETEEVMKQLKYIEMMRPRLAAKRRRMEGSKSNGSHDP